MAHLRVPLGCRALLLGLAVSLGAVAPSGAQTNPPEKPKTLWDEVTLFGYVENSYVWNLGHTGRDDVNELRLYDFDAGYSFNMAELSVKKEPTDRYPFGFGLVVTGGQDAQKTHAIGIFRDKNDLFPFRNTTKVDLQEAYGSYRVPVGSGLTLKAGKFVTLLGYEVIESPNNLNFSRSFLFAFAIPLTHVGGLASYAPTDWLTVTAGPVVGWDIADDNNGQPSVLGQFALTPAKDLTTSLNWIAGKEYSFDGLGHLANGGTRYVLDWVATYTGLKNVTLGLNVDYGHEDNEGALRRARTRSDSDARWWGWAAYGAYDWTESLRTAVRAEYFTDAAGVRTAALGAGAKVSLWEGTATVQYKIWRGLVGRLEYRHDSADEKVFKVRGPRDLAAGGKTQDTVTVALYYSFF
jgi:hypothetical protein